VLELQKLASDIRRTAALQLILVCTAKALLVLCQSASTHLTMCLALIGLQD
jgi:hypothetical protein